MFPKLYWILIIYLYIVLSDSHKRVNMKIVAVFLVVASIIFSGCAEVKKIPSPEDVNNTLKEIDYIGVVDVAEINVSSSAFENNGMIPRKYTCDGENINPPLEFADIPDGTKSLVLIVDDPDAPMGTFTHWVIWGIEPGVKIEENSVPGIEGRNSFRKVSYGGPCPPSGTHRYFFTVYALDADINMKPGASRNEVEKAMEGHIIAKGQLMGKYSR